MSQPQTTRRLALLTSSSLALAAIVSMGSAGLVLTPTAALAYDECTPTPSTSTGTDGVNGVSDPTINDPGLLTRNADSFTCAAAAYAGGITYTSNGALTVVTSGTGTVASNAVGVNLTGSAADTVTFTAANAVTGTAGPAIDVTSATGAINITTAAITANTGTASHAIRAISGGGNITIATSGTINANSNTVTAGDSAIEARVTAGDGSVSIQTGGSVTGRLRGIYAQSSGTGTLSIVTSGSVGVNTTTTSGGIGQIAAIHAISGTGTLTMDVGSVTGTAGSAIRAVAGGTVTLATRGNVIAGLGGTGDATPSQWVIDIDGATGATTTINNTGLIRSNASGSPSGLWFDDKAIRVTDSRVVVNNSGGILGTVDFSAAAGGVTFNANAVTGRFSETGWHTRGTSLFSAGADVVNIAAGGRLLTGGAYFESGSNLIVIPAGGIATTLNFGAGTDTLNNSGSVVIGYGQLCFPSECSLEETVTTFSGLEAFNNSGLIILGGQHKYSVTVSNALNPQGIADGKSDRQPNDRLLMPGTAFTGAGGSRIALDVDYAFSGGGQAGCVGSAVAGTSFYAASDCIDLSGGSTAGSTLVTLMAASEKGINSGEAPDVYPGYRGAYIPDGVVLIDVSGGTSAASHFTLDPASELYSSAFGGVIDEGLFFYTLGYDADTQQHKLYGLPGGGLQFAPMAGAVQDSWRSSTGTWFDRQADLRGATADEPEGGIWIRGSIDAAKRNVAQTVSAAGAAYTFDNTYNTNGYSVTAGLDLIRSRDADQTYVLGLMAGYAHSDLEFVESPNSARFNGVTGGLYASYMAGGAFVDAAVTAEGLVMRNEMPGLRIVGPAGVELDANVRSLGARVEGGWRLALGEAAFVEPIATLAYVTTTFEDVEVPDSTDPVSRPSNFIEYDDAASLRGGLGARFGVANLYGPVSVRYSLLARAWNEFDGEVGLVIRNSGPQAPVTDDFSGKFGEVGGGVTLANDAGTVSGFVSASGMFSGDYRSASASAGFRYRW